MKKKTSYFLLIAFGFLGFAAVFISTKWDVGVSPDSIIFIEAAGNISSGLGYTTLTDNGNLLPITHFPPLYPYMLSFADLFALDLITGARWSCALIFCVNIILAGLLIMRFTRGSFLAMVSGAFFMSTSVDMLRVHTNVLTEPLFILFTLSGLLFLVVYIESSKFHFLLLSSMTLALAFLTRYPGLVTVAAGALALLIMGKKSVPGRLVDVAVFALLSFLPLGFWLVKNYYITGGMANRELFFHPITLGHLRIGMSTVSAWLLPREVPEMLRCLLSVVIAIGVIALMVTLYLKNRKFKIDSSRKMFVGTIPLLLVVFIIAYGMFLVFSISFFDASTMPNHRIMAPVFLTALILIVCVVYRLFVTSNNFYRIKTVLVVVCVILSASYLVCGTMWIYRSHEDGQGFTSRYWKECETMQMAKSLPEAVDIYTNGIEAIKVNTDKNAHWLPAVMNPLTREPCPGYLSHLDNISLQIKNGTAALVWFDRINWRSYLISRDEIRNELPESLLKEFADGFIYHAAR